MAQVARARPGPAFTPLHPPHRLQGAKGVYSHFHRPFNDHSRYLAVASEVRDLTSPARLPSSRLPACPRAFTLACLTHTRTC